MPVLGTLCGRTKRFSPDAGESPMAVCHIGKRLDGKEKVGIESADDVSTGFHAEIVTLTEPLFEEDPE